MLHLRPTSTNTSRSIRTLVGPVPAVYSGNRQRPAKAMHLAQESKLTMELKLVRRQNNISEKKAQTGQMSDASQCHRQRSYK